MSLNDVGMERDKYMEELKKQGEFMQAAEFQPEDDDLDSPTLGFSFGMRLGCVREEAELSMNKMAKSLGIASSTWKNYEEDVTMPDTPLLMKFCEMYNVDPHWLMTNCGNMYVKEPASRQMQPKW